MDIQSADDKKNANIQTLMDKAMKDENTPKLYGNNFFIALGTGDVSLLLRNSNKDIAIINLSYTTAKSLSLKLQDIISFLENKSKTKIMTSTEIENMMKKEEVLQ